ncbi:MAG: N-glycosylase/DNA lyase [Ignavibacteriae bacterium]|nr:N-glycosylase/DNA lyase [Ignavibacteriota bacterium]
MNNAGIEQLTQLYEDRKTAIRARLQDFANVPRTEFFYEVLYCLLTPQTSAENADAAVTKLKKLDFEEKQFNPEPILSNKRHYIRFHKTKAKHLIRLKSKMEPILAILANGSTSYELREWLVKNVKGIGYKEATHFLRNIGKNGGLAILDRHILRNLKRYGAIRSLPKTLSRKQYLSIEKKFMKFSERVGISIDELDLLFWSMETGVIRK